MPIEQDPTENAVAATELEAMRKHHGGHHGHDGDDNCYDGDHYGDEPDPETPEEVKHGSIEHLAYQIWQTHGGDGRDVQDWLSAERLVNAGIIDISEMGQ